MYRRTIGRYLDESRRLAAECSGSLRRPTRVERVAAVLIESGVLYFIFFVSRSTPTHGESSKSCAAAGSHLRFRKYA